MYSQSLRKHNLDSNINEKAAAEGSSDDNFFLRILRLKYNFLYGWQDRMIESVDKMTLESLTVLPGL